jgi:hypothetical protein
LTSFELASRFEVGDFAGAGEMRDNMYDEMNEHFADQLIGEESFDADGYGDGSVQATQDGCHVEPDGTCPHGYVSPTLRLLF